MSAGLLGPWSRNGAARAGPYGPVPGPARGVLARLRSTVGGWLGPRLSRQAHEHLRPGAPDPFAVLRSEKAASGPRGVVLPAFLPYLDDQTGETEAHRRAYRKMLADPNVKAAFLGSVLAVAALDLTVTPADKKNARDRQVAEFVQWNLTDRLQGGIPELAWSVLSGGLVDGYSVCEKVWGPEGKGKYQGNIVLRAVKPKDTLLDLALQTDEFRNVVGILGLRYNAGLELDPADYLIYRHLPLYNIPTGMSAFRAVYSRWWALDTAWKLRLFAAEKRAVPLIIGHYKNPLHQPALERILALVRWQNWFSVPEEARLEALNVAGQADTIFRELVQDLREEVFLGVQGATLQALVGQQGTQRGNSKVHEATADLAKWYLASTLQSLLNDREAGLIRDIVDLNYVVSEYPRATLSAVDVDELTKELAIDAGLRQMGLPLSQEQTYERYNRKPPEQPGDALAGPAPQPSGGSPSPGGSSGEKPPPKPGPDDELPGGAEAFRFAECKTGQTAAQTRCTPERPAPAKSRPGAAATTGAQARKKAARRDPDGKQTGAAPAPSAQGRLARLEKAATELVQQNVARLPKPVRVHLKAAWGALTASYRAGWVLASEVAAESGLDADRVKHLASVLAAADAVWAKVPALYNAASWAARHAGLELGEIPEAAGFVPAASLAYVTYAGFRHPLRALRVAHRVATLAAAKAHRYLPHAETDRTAAAAKLAGRMAKARDPRLFGLVVAAALDRTKGDLAQAVALADVALAARKPEQHAEDTPQSALDRRRAELAERYGDEVARAVIKAAAEALHPEPEKHAEQGQPVQVVVQQPTPPVAPAWPFGTVDEVVRDPETGLIQKIVKRPLPPPPVEREIKPAGECEA